MRLKSPPGRVLTVLPVYKDLPHPPACYLSVLHQAGLVLNAPLANVNYAYRTADGSYYNPLFPTLGMAGAPIHPTRVARKSDARIHGYRHAICPLRALSELHAAQ